MPRSGGVVPAFASTKTAAVSPQAFLSRLLAAFTSLFQTGPAPRQPLNMILRSPARAESVCAGRYENQRMQSRLRVGPLQALPSRGEDSVRDNSSMLQQNELITFLTADGIVQIPGRPYYVPRRPKIQQPMPSWEEQTLCIGQTFQVAAWSKDPNRRIAWLGFCQSVDLLHECVEETVLNRGGEIIEQERQLKSGVHEKLKLTVCIPYLFGVPPEVEVLSAAIQQGGGIVDKVYQQWGIYPLHNPLRNMSGFNRGSSSSSSAC